MSGSYDLVVVANRLPVDQRVEPDGSTSWHTSPGGLVAALEPVLRRHHGAWVGWAGGAGDLPEQVEADGLHLVPVPLSESEIEDYYEGMSNGTLWPLYHDVISPPIFHRRWWEAYVVVNRRFAEAAGRQAAPQATVWVQDYQLQLVPQLLRRLRPDLRIGFFNHIPFPPYEIYAQLPWRRQVLDGLLGADLLGFQRQADANNVLRACRRLGMTTRRGVALVREPDGVREVRCEAFPISVDAAALDQVARRPSVELRAKQIRAELGDPEVVLLGVDRLDYTKGILHRLKAVGELFDEGRLSTPGAALVQVATPSRERVGSYQALRDEVEVEVGRINGLHAELGHPAVHYLHQSFPREELAALYLAADVMLVTALRDGMNLVAKEYVVSRHDEAGALVLSEFTGAAGQLTQAYVVNPHDIEGLKDTIMRAVQAPARESARRVRAMRRQVFAYDVGWWAASFLRALGSRELVEPQTDRLRIALAELAAKESILIALDFDGVLAPIVERPQDARALPEAMAAVDRLAGLPRTHVALVSGRSLESLRSVARPGPGLTLIGGHGAESDDEAVTAAVAGLPEPARELLAHVASALVEISGAHPGTEVEGKPTSVAMHTRRCARPVAASAARAVLDGPAGWPGVHPIRGKEVLELSVSAATKGTALQALRSRLGIGAGAVVYLGDDVTDELAFGALDQTGGDLAIKVGNGETIAGHRVADPAAVAQLLGSLAERRAAAVASSD